MALLPRAVLRVFAQGPIGARSGRESIHVLMPESHNKKKVDDEERDESWGYERFDPQKREQTLKIKEGPHRETLHMMMTEECQIGLGLKLFMSHFDSGDKENIW